MGFGVYYLFRQHTGIHVFAGDCAGNIGGCHVGGVADGEEVAGPLAHILVCCAEWGLSGPLFFVYQGGPHTNSLEIDHEETICML